MNLLNQQCAYCISTAILLIVLVRNISGNPILQKNFPIMKKPVLEISSHGNLLYNQNYIQKTPVSASVFQFYSKFLTMYCLQMKYLSTQTPWLKCSDSCVWIEPLSLHSDGNSSLSSWNCTKIRISENFTEMCHLTSLIIMGIVCVHGHLIHSHRVIS